MNVLNDCITYFRRIVKTPSNASLTDNLIIDYINRFWLMDMSARVQLFDLKTKYQFQTTPGIDQYNMPLYDAQVQPGGQVIAPFPVYQGFTGNARVNGLNVPFYTQRSEFGSYWATFTQQQFQVGTGDGTAGPYTFDLSFFPIIPGHVDMTGIIATGVNQDPIYTNTLNLTVPTTSVYSGVYFTATGTNGQNIIVADSGQFLQTVTDGDLYGLMMEPGNAPLGNQPLGDGISSNVYSMALNTINYTDGTATIRFPTSIPAGEPINLQAAYVVPGLPRAILYYNNIITLRNPPSTQFLVELDAYLTPAAFLATSQAFPFGYMTEYIARGAARKMLSDTGDWEQYDRYEPLFKEQETLVWKRSQRQFTATRVPTIYANTGSHGGYNNNGYGIGF